MCRIVDDIWPGHLGLYLLASSPVLPDEGTIYIKMICGNEMFLQTIVFTVRSISIMP